MDGILRASARVLAIQDHRTELGLAPPTACGACRAQPLCGARHEKRVQVARAVDARPGDVVSIELAAARLVGGAALAYLLPAASMLAGTLLLAQGGDALAALGAFSGLGLGIVALRLAARRGALAAPRIRCRTTVSTPLQGDAP